MTGTTEQIIVGSTVRFAENGSVNWQVAAVSPDRRTVTLMRAYAARPRMRHNVRLDQLRKV